MKSSGPQAAALLWDLVERSQHLKVWTQLTFSLPSPIWTQGNQHILRRFLVLKATVWQAFCTEWDFHSRERRKSLYFQMSCLPEKVFPLRNRITNDARLPGTASKLLNSECG